MGSAMPDAAPIRKRSTLRYARATGWLFRSTWPEMRWAWRAAIFNFVRHFCQVSRRYFLVVSSIIMIPLNIQLPEWIIIRVCRHVEKKWRICCEKEEGRTFVSRVEKIVSSFNSFSLSPLTLRGNIRRLKELRC